MYKLNNAEGTEVKHIVSPETHRIIKKGHRWWEDYELWLAEGNTVEPYKTEEDLKKEKVEKIKKDYFVELELTVEVTIPEGTFTFNGGFDSASLIHQEVQWAMKAGRGYAEVTDVNNEVITMTLSSAEQVAFIVGTKARDAFFSKQKKLRDLDTGVTNGN